MQVVEDDPDRVIADRLYVRDADMPPAGNQNLLSRTVTLNLGGRA